MRIHRLVLTNYRGISHREIEFPERGVTVVCGPNEIGKSSMIEALDLLLESKDRSTKKDVKEVKPTHADVGAEVTAEISTGGYRFVYRKRFHKKCETALTVITPQRAQYTGDEAHERVLAMLAETVDTGLWQAQRVLQATSTAAVDLSGCDALSRALDVAAGDTADLTDLSGAEPLLIEKIDGEYARYFTATGRPTGPWAAATAALRAAETEVAQCAAAVAEVDDRVLRHTALTDELAELTSGSAEVTARVAAAEAAAAEVTALGEQLRTATTEADAAQATSAAAAAAHKERLRLRAEVDTRAEAVEHAGAAAAEAAAAAITARAVVAEAEQLAEQAAAVVLQANERAEAAAVAVATLAEREEATRLTVRLGKIDAASAELDIVATALQGIALTERGFQAIEKAAAAVDLAQAQVDLTAPTVAVTAAADIELTVDGRPITLAAGQTHRLSAAEAVAIGLPGVGTVAVTPGASGAETQAKLAVAQGTLTELLAASGVSDLAAARQLNQTRGELLGKREQLAAVLSGLLGDDEATELRLRLQTLRQTHPADAGPIDAAAVRAEHRAADSARTEAATDCEKLRKVAAAAVAKCAESETAATLLRDKAVGARTEHDAVRDRLVAQQTETADDDLAVRARAAADHAAATAALLDELTGRLAAADPQTVLGELDAARTAATTRGRRRDEVALALNDVTVELNLIGTEGRTGKLDAALVRREHAAAEYGRVQRRANAARTLRDVMARHRDNTRLRYVEPFRIELEQLGRIVFGESFEVEVDSALRIVNRTLDGRTVPFESLSGGAREQLGILSRLAVAALVDRDDAVPVMIDDALGFSDPDRLAKMGAVFDSVGERGQVIVLTCVSERYRAVAAAHTVDLTP